MSFSINRPRHIQSLLCLLLLFGVACKRPETALRERPVQLVELVQSVPGMTPDEERALVAQVAQGLGLPSGSLEPPAGPHCVFQITLTGRSNSMVGRGLGRTCLVSFGTGALLGVLLPTPFAIWGTWESAAIAAGAGGLLGLGYGPVWYQRNAELQKAVGYLPWHFNAEWKVLERRPGVADQVVASSGHHSSVWAFGNQTPTLELKPFLPVLPVENRTETDIRQASLKAYAEALVKHFKQKA